MVWFDSLSTRQVDYFPNRAVRFRTAAGFASHRLKRRGNQVDGGRGSAGRQCF